MYINKCTKPLKFTLQIFDENFVNLFNAIIIFTHVDQKLINYTTQAQLWILNYLVNLSTCSLMINKSSLFYRSNLTTIINFNLSIIISDCIFAL